MKERLFKFYNYELSSNTTSLIEYLESYHVEYEKNNAYILFKLLCDDSKEPLQIKAYYDKDRVINYVIFCFPKDELQLKNIFYDLGSNYLLKSEVAGSDLIEYAANGFRICVKNQDGIEIKVLFYALNVNVDKEARKEKLKVYIPFVVGGALLSGLFITLYFLFKNLIWLHITTAVVAVVFAYLEFYFMYIKNAFMSKSKKIITLIVLPIVFFIILFSITYMEFSDINMVDLTQVSTLIDVAMVICYLLPSFNIASLVAYIIVWLS